MATSGLSNTSALGRDCVKTRLSQGRAELFSQLPSPNRSRQCNRFSTTTKSRRKFYAQFQRRSFHTAWVKRRHGGPEMRLPVCPHKRTQLGHRAMSETCPFKRIMLIGIVEDRPAVEPSAGAW